MGDAEKIPTVIYYKDFFKNLQLLKFQLKGARVSMETNFTFIMDFKL